MKRNTYVYLYIERFNLHEKETLRLTKEDTGEKKEEWT